jgi:hypothetical protein
MCRKDSLDVLDCDVARRGHARMSMRAVSTVDITEDAAHRCSSPQSPTSTSFDGGGKNLSACTRYEGGGCETQKRGQASKRPRGETYSTPQPPRKSRVAYLCPCIQHDSSISCLSVETRDRERGTPSGVHFFQVRASLHLQVQSLRVAACGKNGMILVSLQPCLAHRVEENPLLGSPPLMRP